MLFPCQVMVEWSRGYRIEGGGRPACCPSLIKTRLQSRAARRFVLERRRWCLGASVRAARASGSRTAGRRAVSSARPATFPKRSYPSLGEADDLCRPGSGETAGRCRGLVRSGIRPGSDGSRPEADTAAVPVAGGYAFFFGAGSPLTEAKGMGMSGPVAAEELEAMERVFAGRDVPAKSCSARWPIPRSSMDLTRRGYRPTGFEDVLYRELDRLRPSPRPEGIASRLGRSGRDRTLRADAGRGFVAPEEPGPEVLEITAMTSRSKG